MTFLPEVTITMGAAAQPEARGGLTGSMTLEDDKPKRDYMTGLRQLNELQEYNDLKGYAMGLNLQLKNKRASSRSTTPTIHSMINTKIKTKRFRELITGEPTTGPENASRDFRKALERHKALDKEFPQGWKRKISSNTPLNGSLNLSKGHADLAAMKPKTQPVEPVQVFVAPLKAKMKKSGRKRKAGHHEIAAVERANSDVFVAEKRPLSKSSKRRNREEEMLKERKNNDEMNAALRDYLTANRGSSRMRSGKSVRFTDERSKAAVAQSPGLSAGSRNNSGIQYKPTGFDHQSRRGSEGRINSATSFRIAKPLEPYKRHELVTKMSAVRAAQKLDINLLSNLFQDENLHNLRLSVTGYPPAVLKIIERAEERLRKTGDGMDLTYSVVEEMRDKWQKAKSCPNLYEEWAPSRVLYSKSLLPSIKR